MLEASDMLFTELALFFGCVTCLMLAALDLQKVKERSDTLMMLDFPSLTFVNDRVALEPVK